MQRTGIFGGSFNPIHKAHITLAREFINQARLDICLFIPAYITPFKESTDELKDISPEHRVNMVNLVAEKERFFEIENYEIKKRGISYTIDTILYLKDKYPESELFLFIGGDHAKNFNRWRKWDEILDNVTLCIAHRPGTLSDIEKNNIEMKLVRNGKEPIWLNTPLINISSSAIREKISKGKDVSSTLDKDVVDYIMANGLYRE